MLRWLVSSLCYFALAVEAAGEGDVVLAGEDCPGARSHGMFGTWSFQETTFDGKGYYRKKVPSSAFGISYQYWYLYYDEDAAPEGVLRPRPLDLDNSLLHPHSRDLALIYFHTYPLIVFGCVMQRVCWHVRQKRLRSLSVFSSKYCHGSKTVSFVVAFA